jgi:hypothetical protein
MAREEAVPEEEGGGFVRGAVGRLLKSSVGAPNAALGYLGEQFAGWKSEFMTIFQTEVRRFLDRVDPGEELKKVIAGRRLEISASIRLVDDDGTHAKPARVPKPAKAKAKRGKKP